MQDLRPHCIIFMHYRSCPITADQTWRSCLAGSDVTKNAEGVVQSLEVTEGIKIYQNHARNPFRDLLSYVVMSAHVRFIKIQSRYMSYCTDSDEKEWRRLILACSDFLRHLPSSSIIFHHLPSSSIIFHHLPSSSIIFHHLPSSSIIFHHLPSSSIIFIFKTCQNMPKQYSSGLTIASPDCHIRSPV